MPKEKKSKASPLSPLVKGSVDGRGARVAVAVAVVVGQGRDDRADVEQ